MGALRKRFVEAGAKRGVEPNVGQGWPVFEEYVETEEGGDIFLNAVVKPIRPTRDPGLPTVETISAKNLRDAEERSVKRYIAPITQHKDLFLEFARQRPPRSEKEALKTTRAWVSEYGVLGLYGVDDPRRSGRRESVSGFVRAASDAAMVLDFYEAAIPKRPDHRLGEVLERWERGAHWDKHSVEKQREYALGRVADMVGCVVKDECYPQLWREVNEARRHTQGFVYDFGFYSLLGAMYLQMMLLLTDAEQVRQCRRPGCHGTIPPHTRSDKVYCDRPACKVWWSDNFGDSKKARAKQERQRRDSDTT